MSLLLKWVFYFERTTLWHTAVWRSMVIDRVILWIALNKRISFSKRNTRKNDLTKNRYGYFSIRKEEKVFIFLSNPPATVRTD